MLKSTILLLMMVKKTTLNKKSKIMMKTPNCIMLEYDCYIDPSINNEFYHILLRMNFLDQFTAYEINPLKLP